MTNRPLEGSGPDAGGLASIHANVEVRHECRAQFRDTVRVREGYEGEAVWDGNVYVFDLTDHPTAEIAYGWSDPVPGTDRRRFYAVLHTGPVDSPHRTARSSPVA